MVQISCIDYLNPNYRHSSTKDCQTKFKTNTKQFIYNKEHNFKWSCIVDNSKEFCEENRKIVDQDLSENLVIDSFDKVKSCKNKKKIIELKSKNELYSLIKPIILINRQSRYTNNNEQLNSSLKEKIDDCKIQNINSKLNKNIHLKITAQTILHNTFSSKKCLLHIYRNIIDRIEKSYIKHECSKLLTLTSDLNNNYAHDNSRLENKTKTVYNNTVKILLDSLANNASKNATTEKTENLQVKSNFSFNTKNIHSNTTSENLKSNQISTEINSDESSESFKLPHFLSLEDFILI